MKKVLLFTVFAALVFLSFHFLAFAGHFGYDDMGYARLADSVNKGTFSLLNDHYAYRWGVIFPTAFFYSLFGVNDFSSALPALLAAILCSGMIVFVLRHKSNLVIALSLALFVFSYWILGYADKLMPDIQVCLWATATLFALYLHRFDNPKQNNWIHALVFSTALFLALISKETIILQLPVLFIIFLSDVFKRQYWRFWLLVIGFCVMYLVFYLGLIYTFTGSITQRLTAIKAGAYFNPCSYDQLPLKATLDRIFKELWLVFLGTGTALPLGIGLLSLRLRSVFNFQNSPTQFWAATLLWSVLSANFMTVSPLGYIPMCPDIRHFLYLVPIAACASASSFEPTKPSGRLFLIALVAGLTLCAWLFSSYDVLVWYYAPIFIATCLLVLRAQINTWGVLVFIISIALLDISNMFSPLKKDYAAQKSLIEKHFLGQTKNVLVISDPVQCTLGEYYLDFDTTYVKFRNYDQIGIVDSTSLIKRFGNIPNVYAIDGWFTRWLSNTEDGRFQQTVKIQDALPVKDDISGVRLLIIEER